MKQSFTVLIFAAGFMLFVLCANMGTGTQVGNPKVAGVIYNDNGTRASGAKVACIPRKHNPYSGENSGGDSTVTDDTGAYKFETMSADTYDILASKDTSMAFRDPVVVTNDQNTHVPPDTLKPAGSVRGVVRFEEGGDMSTVFILFFGTRTFTWPDDSLGNFTTGPMAAGQYRARVLTTTPDYLYANDTFDVRAGRNDTLPDTIVLKYTGIPIPRNLQIQYDTMKQIVTLYWNTPTTGRIVQSYTVYRKRSDSASFVSIKAGVTDTVYSDSTGVQDQTYEYRVAVVDTNATEGVKSMVDSVTIQPAFIITDTIFKVQGQAWVYAVEIDSQGNFVVVNGTAYNPTPANIERYSPSGTLINSWSIPGGVEEMYVYNCLARGDSNTIFVVTKDNLVIRYDTAGAILSQFQYPGTASGIGILKDTIYIGDRTAHIVRAYSSAGDSLFSWGSQGSGAGQFGSIGALKTNSANGNVFIEDGQDTINRLQIFDRNGIYKFSFYFQGQGKGLLDGGELDVRNDTILVCNSSLIGAFTINGSIAFRYGIFNPNAVFRKAIFDTLASNIILINVTGEVMRISRK
jgi:hypothetical protein